MADQPPRSIDAGMFNVARPSYSASTLQLVKLLMEETRVPKLQQRLFEQSLRSGQPLPPPRRPAGRGRAPPAVSSRTEASSGRRSRLTIARLQSEDGGPGPAYRPRPGRDRDAERERLAYVMTHGRQRPGGEQEARTPEEPPRQEDRFEELWQEVEERRQFLAEMRGLGRGAEYEAIIRGEVARLVQEMEQLQRQGQAAGDGQEAAEEGR